MALLTAAMIMLSCSEDDPDDTLGNEDQQQLELTTAGTTVETGSTVLFEVTAGGQSVSDADLYIDGERTAGYQHVFDETGTKTVQARKTGYKDSAPLTITIEEKPADVDIYVLGQEGTSGLHDYRPLYWKNGEAVAFSHETPGSMIYYSMDVANDNIYAAGERIYSSSRAAAFYWADDSHEELTGSDGYAKALDICVTNGDVYTGGIKNESGSVISVVYWKNGEPVTVASGAVGATAGGPIAVKGNDVYMAGMLDGALMYWKNGTGVSLQGGPGEVTSINVTDNGDVYISGYEWKGNKTIAKYWKNGESIVLGTGDQESEARDIFIEDNDVYVTGWEKIRRPSGSGTVSVARYWKNGEATDLTDGSYRAEANSIFVLDGEVYVAGVEYMEQRSATYWKNGETVRLSDQEFNGYAGDIVVVKKTGN
ncbi:hypothetical protein DN748_08645 [Sinomicrobium soli]|nr:hypothetical protein DN748_08645 [Sinomicrobium sp. N-1-3-6]